MSRMLVVLGLLWAAPVFALSPPMSLEDRTASASVIVDAQVQRVECFGTPVRGENGVVVISYKAYLDVGEIHKRPARDQPFGDLLVGDTMELYFERQDYGTLPQPGCAWSPSYREGQSGRWWLRDDDDDRLTMVSWNSFEPDENNAPLDLPLCDLREAGPEPLPDGGADRPDSGGGGAPDSGDGPSPEAGPPAGDAGDSSANDGGDAPASDAGGATLCRRPDGTLGHCLGEETGCGCRATGFEFGLLSLGLLIAVRRRRRQRA